MHAETEADVSVTEELIALTKEGQIKRKNLEWERSRSNGGPDMKRSEKKKVIIERSKGIEIGKQGEVE